jgi:hypothetical protein
LCSGFVKCVLLNACYSEVQAQSISPFVEYVIGMSRAIGDAAAIKFSIGFYDALAAERSFADAFEFGCNAISLKGIPESLTPMMIIRNHPQSHTAGYAVGKGREGSDGNIRCVNKAPDAPVQELIRVLDFRADMVLATMEEHKRNTLKAVAERGAAEPGRDLTVAGLSDRLDVFAKLFSELHEQNKRALIEGQFVLSHEITRRIQYLLFELQVDTFWKAFAEPYVQYSVRFPEPWTFASDYPGLAPERLEEEGHPAVEEVWKPPHAEDYKFDILRELRSKIESLSKRRRTRRCT